MTGDGLPPPVMFVSSAARPAGCTVVCRLSFYNIGWDEKSNIERHTIDGLATEICNMVHDKCVDAVGICAVGKNGRSSCNIFCQNLTVLHGLRPLRTAVLHGLRGQAGLMATTYSSGTQVGSF